MHYWNDIPEYKTGLGYPSGTGNFNLGKRCQTASQGDMCCPPWRLQPCGEISIKDYHTSLDRALKDILVEEYLWVVCSEPSISS